MSRIPSFAVLSVLNKLTRLRSWLPDSSDIFVSVGADGSLRAFDLRTLEHSTILYESAADTPLARIAFSNREQSVVVLIYLSNSKFTDDAGTCWRVSGWTNPKSSFSTCAVPDSRSLSWWAIRLLLAGSPGAPEEPTRHHQEAAGSQAAVCALFSRI